MQKQFFFTFLNPCDIFSKHNFQKRDMFGCFQNVVFYNLYTTLAFAITVI